MEAQVEPQLGLSLGDRAGDVFADIAGFEDGSK
jgi:hypothetical protein